MAMIVREVKPRWRGGGCAQREPREGYKADAHSSSVSRDTGTKITSLHLRETPVRRETPNRDASTANVSCTPGRVRPPASQHSPISKPGLAPPKRHRRKKRGVPAAR